MNLVMEMNKKKKKNENIYCLYCGAENINTDTQCKKCKKDLHSKNEPFKDFLYRHIKDDLKSNVEDSIFSYLKNFIISHLYGTAMTISILFTITSIIISPKSSYKVVSSLNEINQIYSGGIIATIYTYDDSCDEGFPEELIDVPFPAAGFIVSGRKKIAININLNKGESINDWCKNGHEEDIICNVPLYLYDSKVDDLAKNYREKLYAYADWYHNNDTHNDDEYFDRSSDVDLLAYELMYENDLKEFNKETPINKSIDLFISEVGCEH